MYVCMKMLELTDLRHGQLLIQTHGYIEHEEQGCTEHEDEDHHLVKNRIKQV